MKRRERYRHALHFSQIMFERTGDDEAPSMKHPIILEAASRFRLSPPQLRRLVSELRKRRASE